MSKVKILFIRNLMGRTTEDQIKAVFNNLSNGEVDRVKKSRDYAFVHFTTRQAAERALSGVNSENGTYLQLDGAEVEVTWSKPVDKYAYNTRKLLTKWFTDPNYSYLNLPHSMDPNDSSMMIHMMNGYNE